MFNHVTTSVKLFKNNTHIFPHEWSHATSKAGAPAKHWMESHQCECTWQINMQKQTSSIFRKTLDTWSLVVRQRIQFKKFLLFILLLQTICPHWLRTATALVLVSTCHVLPWSWNNCFLLASGTSFQVSTWWIKLSQHMPNCISKAVGRWVHLDCSEWLDHWKTNNYCN